MRLAERIANELRSQGGVWCSWGDGILVDVCYDHVKIRNKHPLNVMKAACDAMERAPDIFEKLMIRGHDARCRPRLIRAFKLRPSPSVEDGDA